MAKQKWIRIESGIRARLHATRKHGVKPDLYFVLRYTIDGKKKQESLGWASEGWNVAKARTELHRLKEAARTGEGPVTLAEKRQKAKAAREAERAHLTIGGLWMYYLDAHQDKAGTAADKSNVKHLAELLDVYPEHLRTAHVDKLRRGLEAQGKAAQTVKHVLGLLRRILRYCEQRGLCTVPSRGLLHYDMPKVDNQKTECLTREQIKTLHDALESDRDQNLAAMVQLALLTGMRRGALFGLKWEDVDFHTGDITLRGKVAKCGKTSSIPMSEEARTVLLGVHRTLSPYVFPGRNGGKRVECRNFLKRIRNLAVLPDNFRMLHGLRHTYASILASRGQGLLMVKELLTHSDYKQTSRYAHLADQAKRNATAVASEYIRSAVNAEPQPAEDTGKVLPFGGGAMKKRTK